MNGNLVLISSLTTSILSCNSVENARMIEITILIINLMFNKINRI